MDLRKRIVDAYGAGGSTQQAVADRFGVSLWSVQKLWQQWCATGDLSPGKRGRPPQRSFDGAAEQRLHHAVRKHPDATLAELANLCGVACCEATVFNTLKRLGYRRKKNATRERT
jgi:transposase